jgi:hypothetical protein
MITIIGIHEVDAAEPCHLVEAGLDPPDQDFDWGLVTQEEPGQPRDNWQVPYDERPLDETGERWAFFFHYFDPDRDLLGPDGPVAVPQPSPLPEHLKEIEYEEP